MGNINKFEGDEMQLKEHFFNKFRMIIDEYTVQKNLQSNDVFVEYDKALKNGNNEVASILKQWIIVIVELGIIEVPERFKNDDF